MAKSVHKEEVAHGHSFGSFCAPKSQNLKKSAHRKICTSKSLLIFADLSLDPREISVFCWFESLSARDQRFFADSSRYQREICVFLLIRADSIRKKFLYKCTNSPLSWWWGANELLIICIVNLLLIHARGKTPNIFRSFPGSSCRLWAKKKFKRTTFK